MADIADKIPGAPDDTIDGISDRIADRDDGMSGLLRQRPDDRHLLDEFGTKMPDHFTGPVSEASNGAADDRTGASANSATDSDRSGCADDEFTHAF